MKKILIKALALVSIATIFSLPITAHAQELSVKPEVRAVAVESQEETKLFIGLIKDYKDGIVEVGKLFDLENDIKETDTVYIDVTKAEFPNGEIKEYPKGYIITINYNDIVIEDDVFKIVASKVEAVEEDQVVTICDESSTSDEQNIEEEVVQNIEEDVVQNIEPKLYVDEVNPSFWDEIVAFFKNLFN